MGARFCEACGSPVGGTGESSAPARKVVSVVFGDLVGSTALQEKLDPESAQRVMARFYEVMRAVIDRHGGHLDKFVGDGVVVAFGVPSVREDDALRAVRCATAMIADLATLSDELERDWGLRLRMRTGVNTGELVISGDGELVGDAVNTAARLEQAAAPGDVLIGEPTWRLVRSSAQLEAVEPLALKGKTEPVRAWRVLAVESGADPRSRIEVPLVGRVAELGRLRAALDVATDARGCRLVTVIGSPGMGKTRLAEEFELAVASDAAVVHGRCEPTGEGITFGPVAELLRGGAWIGDTDPPDTVRAKLAALVEGEQDAERIVARAGSLLGVADPASVQETFWGVRRILEALARRRPLVVVLDDVHWGQPLFLDLVEHLVEWVRDAPMLLLVLSRPELREGREALTTPGRRVSEVLELAPLASAESQAFVEGLLGRAELPPDLLDRILDTTEGNPLFLGETLRMLVDDGTLTRRGETWITAAGAAVTVPPTISALLTARIERLRHEERAVVERAAVIGKQFYRGAVAELVTPPVRSELDTHLETLRRKEMVEPDGTYWVDEPVYRFHHVLLRDAAYRSLLKEARAELHERFADWLTAKAGDLVGEHEEVIAYHLEQAHEYRRQLGPLDEHGHVLGARAATTLGSVGRRALARADHAAAANLLRRGLDRGERDDPEMLWDLAEALLAAGDTAGARDAADRLATAGHATRADVFRGQIAILTGTTTPDATVEQLTAAAGELAAAGDGPGAAKAHHVTAQALAQLGRLGAAEAELDQALLAARKAGDRRRVTAALAAAPRAALWGPSPIVRAGGRCLDVLRILRMSPGNRHVEAIALRCQAVLEAMRGRLDPARAILTTARTTLQELGLTLELHELTTHAGIVELLAGDPAAAEAHLRPARDGFTALGIDVGAAQAAALLARALLDQGRDDDALDQTRFAEQHAGGDLKTTITWCGVRAEALARRGDAAEALALARRAVALADPTDALPDKADATLTLARVLRTLGQPDEARAAARQARDLYQAKDHAVGGTRATELAGSTATPQHTPAPNSRLLGNRPPERVWAGIIRGYNVERDFDGAMALFADDVVFVDHRNLGWSELDKEGLRGLFESFTSAAPDVHIEIDEVLACDDRVIALTYAFHGHSGDGGGAFEIANGLVYLIEDGLVRRGDRYEYDDRQAMIARYAELGGGLSPLGDRPSERVLREACIRVTNGDLNGFFALYTDDHVTIDHRKLGWSQTIQGSRDIFESLLATTTDARWEVDEVLACDDRIVALSCAFRGTQRDGGGTFEIPYGMVAVVDDGLFRRTERFEHDDRDAMLTRYGELGGRRYVLGDRPPELVIAQWIRRWRGRDVERILELFADDVVRIDHRRLAWDEARGHSGIRELYESALPLTVDLRADADEVLACDQQVIAFTVSVRGTGAEGGGGFEVVYGMVAVVENGQVQRFESYEPDDRQAMIARYAELGGGLSPLGNRPSERVVRDGFVRMARGDLDGVFALYADDHVMIDHRRLGWTETDPGARDVIESMLATTMDARFEVDEVLACDDRTVAFTGAFRGTHLDGGGTFEIPYGVVMGVEGGLIRRTERFEHDDRDAMLARYAELGGRQHVLGDRPPERVIAEWSRRWRARDLDALVGMFADDIVRTDHRRLSWDDVQGRDALYELYRSARDVWPDLKADVGEVLACDDQVIAFTFVASGTAADSGGMSEIPMGVLALVENDRICHWDQYEHDNRKTMLARYAELGGGLGPLGDRPPERFMREFCRRFATCDVDALLELYTEDYRRVDHRVLGWEEHGRAEQRTLFASLFEAGSDWWVSVDAVLACDDRSIAQELTFHCTNNDGGGPSEISFGALVVIDDGRIARTEQFDREQREPMLARFAELGGRRQILGDRPPERAFAEWVRRFNAHDLDGVVALYTDDHVRVDHRNLGWEEISAEGPRLQFASLFAAAPDMRGEVDEVLACDDRVIAFRFTFHATSVDGGGPAEIPIGAVVLIENGLLARSDLYGPDDRKAIIARYAELGGGQGALGDRPPELVLREMTCRFARRGLDGFLELVGDDFVMVDHRKLGWSETDKQGYRGIVESMFAASVDVRVEIDEVLACDDRTIAFRSTMRGHTSDGGGSFEIAFGLVSVIDNGLIRRTERFEDDDRQGVLARFAELGGRREVLGDRPPERLLIELFRRAKARDVEGFVALLSDRYVDVDHRRLAWDEEGRADARARLEAYLAASSDFCFDIDEVLACDDRVIALSMAVRGTSLEGGGTYEVAYGGVGVVEDGLLQRFERFEIDDRQAALARFAELGGGQGALGDRPPERHVARFLRRWAARDVPELLDLYADGYRRIDHRMLGWGETTKAEQRELYESFLASAADVWGQIQEVLACDDRVIALTCTFHGRITDGDGAYEIPFGAAIVVENGRVSLEHNYEPDDREAMLARFAELGGRPEVLGDRPPDRVVARLCRQWTVDDLDALVGLFTDDVVRVDHRTLGFDEVHGRPAIRDTYASMFGVSADVRIEPAEVVACDDRILVLRATLRSTAADGGGEFATPCGYLFVVTGDRVQRLEQFEPDDRQAMLTRYAELGGT